MKSLNILIAAILLVGAAFGQEKKSTGPTFDIEDFNKKFETVEWLVE